MSHDIVKLKVEMNADDVNWFREQYPRASLSGMLNTLLSKFREVNTVTPAEYARLAAQSLSEDLKR